jgi:hypothetical protein
MRKQRLSRASVNRPLTKREQRARVLYGNMVSYHDRTGETQRPRVGTTDSFILSLWDDIRALRALEFELRQEKRDPIASIACLRMQRQLEDELMSLVAQSFDAIYVQNVIAGERDLEGRHAIASQARYEELMKWAAANRAIILGAASPPDGAQRSQGN